MKKRNPKANSGQQGTVGLVANASCGGWEVAVDETIAGAQKWFLQLDGPAVSLYLDITSPAIVDRMARFLGKSAARWNSKEACLVIGSAGQCKATLLRDDEYDDRCFLLVGTAAKPVVRLTFQGEDLAKLAQVVRQVRDSLEADDLV